jgi:hypothetical protein
VGDPRLAAAVVGDGRRWRRADHRGLDLLQPARAGVIETGGIQ